MQYPTEVPGVSLQDMLTASFVAAGRDTCRRAGAGRRRRPSRIGFDARFLTRELNVDLSGGEKKRNETLQLGVLAPKIAILDELDSGLDVDALRACARRVEAATNESNLGVLAITHYSRLLTELKPDVVHILVKGRIRATGGPELADELEITGYAAWLGSRAKRPTRGARRCVGPPARSGRRPVRTRPVRGLTRDEASRRGGQSAAYARSTMDDVSRWLGRWSTASCTVS